MLDVFLTVDVEVWCDNWYELDTKLPDAFIRNIYGPTSRGDYGLPYQLQKLQEHGLTGTFYVEPLFSTRLGLNSLAEIIGLIQERDQEIQLHLHTEWADESKKPLVKNITGKRQHLSYFSLEDQVALIRAGAKLIELAGGKRVNAFRAGNFGINQETLQALSENNITFDNSYNASFSRLYGGTSPETWFVEPFKHNAVYEYPMTVFNTGTRSLRHIQITACSYQEMEGLLWQALETGRNAFVIFTHNFELMNRAMNRPDDIVVARFNKICSFLDRNRDCFRVRGFHGLKPSQPSSHTDPLTSPMWKTGFRMLEQGMRRKYG
jgi:hypothetical protein